MRYKLLGKSGVRVSELALGTMTFGEDWGWGASKEESRRIFEAFVAAGGNFIDTACNYTEGTSEKFVGEFIAAERDYFVVATKYTLRPRSANQDDPNAGGNSRKNLMRSVEASLKRLNTDFIDLLYLHMWDYTTAVDEVMRAMDDLVRAGKLLYVGFSDTPAYIVAKADLLAELRSLAPVAAIQLPYNLFRRDPERELLPMAREQDIAVTAWGLIGGGVLSGKYRQPEAVKRYQDASQEWLEVADRVVAIASQVGRTPAQVAIRWVYQQQSQAQIIPILGVRSLDQLEENLGILNFELTAGQIAELDAVTKFDPGFPWSFLHSENVLNLTHGNTAGLLDNHHA
jgi:aryl-alcohol dehydrogenase-like predicted oxidoreductase